jgi:hypothetical protein
MFFIKNTLAGKGGKLVSRDYIIPEILTVLQQCIVSKLSASQAEQILRNTAETCRVEYEDILTLYNKMFRFRMEIEKIGGEEAYEQSEFIWLKEELELLLYVYKFFQKNGISVLVISELLSKNGLNIFPKTKSQLQNTYYKLRNNRLPLENLTKQKPGRKPGQEYPKVSKKANEEPKDTKSQYCGPVSSDIEIRSEESKNSFVSLFSNMIHNFQVILEHDKEKEKQIYQLVEGIYELSHMAAERQKINASTNLLEIEVKLLRQETERLKREKEEMRQQIHSLTANIHTFIEKSDMGKIKGIS